MKQVCALRRDDTSTLTLQAVIFFWKMIELNKVLVKQSFVMRY